MDHIVSETEIKKLAKWLHIIMKEKPKKKKAPGVFTYKIPKIEAKSDKKEEIKTQKEEDKTKKDESQTKEEVFKTMEEVKKNLKYKGKSKPKGEEPEEEPQDGNNISLPDSLDEKKSENQYFEELFDSVKKTEGEKLFDSVKKSRKKQKSSPKLKS